MVTNLFEQRAAAIIYIAMVFILFQYQYMAAKILVKISLEKFCERQELVKVIC